MFDKIGEIFKPLIVKRDETPKNVSTVYKTQEDPQKEKEQNQDRKEGADPEDIMTLSTQVVRTWLREKEADPKYTDLVDVLEKNDIHEIEVEPGATIEESLARKAAAFAQ